MKIIIIVDINENCNVKRVIALNINDFFVTKRVNKNRFINIFYTIAFFFEKQRNSCCVKKQ